MVDTFGLTLEVISRPYRLVFSIEVKVFFPNFVILCLFFLNCLTIVLIWFLSFRYTTESRYFCYYVTLKKIIDNSGYLKRKVISMSFKFLIANIMPSLRYLSVIVLD